MRKRLLSTRQGDPPAEDWLDLDGLAAVEVTSEDAAFPVASALWGEAGPGWRASGPGPQTLRLIFEVPRPLRRLRLEFVEAERERTQEFVLRWSPDPEGPPRELVRQRWNFSPRGGTFEVEDYAADLREVAVLELVVTPDVAGGAAVASLKSLRLA